MMGWNGAINRWFGVACLNYEISTQFLVEVYLPFNVFHLFGAGFCPKLKVVVLARPLQNMSLKKLV